MKNDSGSYAVFSEQRRFLPDYLDARDEASAGVSSYTKVKTEGRSKIAETSQVRMSRHLGTSTKTLVFFGIHRDIAHVVRGSKKRG